MLFSDLATMGRVSLHDAHIDLLLVFLLVGESLDLSGRQRSVLRNKGAHSAIVQSDSERDRVHVYQTHLFDISKASFSSICFSLLCLLDEGEIRSTGCDCLIGVYLVVERLFEVSIEELFDVWNSGRTTNHHDVLDLSDF